MNQGLAEQRHSSKGLVLGWNQSQLVQYKKDLWLFILVERLGRGLSFRQQCVSNQIFQPGSTMAAEGGRGGLGGGKAKITGFIWLKFKVLGVFWVRF